MIVFQSMTIISSEIFRHVVESEWPYTGSGDRLQVCAPDGYLFNVENSASAGGMYNMLLLVL